MSRCFVLLLVLFCVSVLASPLRAQFLVYEGFDYANNTNIATAPGASGGSGWTTNWSGSTDQHAVVTAATQTYTDGNGMSLVTNGLGQRFNRHTRSATRAFGSQGALGSGTYWFSLIIRPTYVPPTGETEPKDLDIQFQVRSSTTVRVAAGEFGFTNSVLSTNWGIRSGSTTSLSDVSGETKVDNVYPAQFLVIKYTVGSSTTDGTIHLFLNPNLGAANEPDIADADAAITGLNSNNMAFDNINLTLAGTGVPVGRSAGYFDEIRGGRTYGDVTTFVPEPTALAPAAMLALGLLRRRARV